MDINQLISVDLNEILFMDIETASRYPSYHEISDETHRNLWESHWKKERKYHADKEHGILGFVKNLMSRSKESVARGYNESAALFPEFGQVICIGLGYFTRDSDNASSKIRFRVKGFMIPFGNILDEKALLHEIQGLFNGCFSDGSGEGQGNQRRFRYLAGHNIRNFDIPYLCKRMVLASLTPLPSVLNIQRKSHWQTHHIIDTMQIWQFGSYHSPLVSLKMLTQLFGVPSPKEELEGSLVSPYFWEGMKHRKVEFLEKIYHYCLADVVAVANLLLKWKGKPILTKEALRIDPPGKANFSD
jgi:hypothetical protein